MKYEDMDKETLIKILKQKDYMIKKLSLEKKKLNYYANVDAMTGALNRRVGLELLSKELDFSKSNDNNLVVCFVDIDRLKKINDIFGHEEGDKVLINAAKAIKDSIRNTDYLIRIGGDEFLIVFPKTLIKDAKKVWRRICRKIGMINKNSDKYNLSLSHGFCRYNKKIQENISIKDLVRRADQIMYKNKLKKEGIWRYMYNINLGGKI